MKKIPLISACCVVLAACLGATPALALTCTSIGTGLNWGAAATWTSVGNCNRVPTNADDVIVANGHVITVNIAGAVAGSVTIAGGATATALNLGGAGTSLTVTNAGGLTGNVTINASTANVTRSLAVGARALTVTGAVTINGGTAGGGGANIGQLSVTTGTASLGSLAINAGSVNTSVARVTLTTGTINVTGDATLTGGVTSNTRDALLSVTGANALGAGVNIGGALNIVSSLAGTSSVTLGTGSRVTVNGAGGVTNEDILSIGAGIFSVTDAAATLTVSDPAIVSVASVTTGSLTVAGNVVVDSGGVGASSLTLTTGVISIGGNLDVSTAGATNDNGDATVSVSTGRIDVTGNVTVTGGSNANRDALLTVSGAGAVGQGVNVGGALNIVSTVAGSATVSTTNAAARITVNGLGGVSNEDMLTVGVGIVSVTNAAATLTISDPAIVSVASVTTGTLTVAGNVVVDSGAIGASSLTLTTGTVSIGGNLAVTAAAAGADGTGDATVSVTTGTLNVTGNATVTGGTLNTQDALLTVTGASTGTGATIGGTLNIVSSVATSATVSTTLAGAKINVGGAGGVNNEDILSVGPGSFSVTNAAATLTTFDAAIAATTSVTTGTLTVAGNAVVNSGGNGLKTLSVTTGLITIGGNLDVTAAAATADTGDATATITGIDGRINVTGNVTVTGGSNANRDALLSVTAASALGRGVNVGGGLNVVSSVAGSSSVTLGTGSRITVNGAGGVSNEDILSIGAGIFSVTNAAATLTVSDPAIVSVASVTTGTLTVAGNVVVDSGAIGASSLTLTSGTVSVGGNLGVTAAAAGANASGDATVSVSTGRIDVTGNVTVTGGTVAGQVATLTATGAGAVGQGVNVGGALNIVSGVVGTAVVSTTNATARITVNGAGGVNNEDTLTVGVGIVSVTNAAATLTVSDPAIVSVASVTTGTLTVAGNVLVSPGAVGASSLTLTTGVVSIGGNLDVSAAAATNDNGDATVSVTTGRIDVTGNVTVTGGSNANRDALLGVTGVTAVGQGLNVGGGLSVVSSVAGSSSVTLGSGSRITVNGAAGVSNEDTLTVGAGILVLSAGNLVNSDAAILANLSVTTGTVTVVGSMSNASGENFTCTGACNIAVSGSFSSSGTFTPSTGTVTFNGVAAQTISGSNPMSFNNMTITNAANPNITLATNVTVSGTLTGTATLTSTCPTDYTLTSPGPLIQHSCPVTVASFNACSGTDACPVVSARLYTRIANRAFALYLAALKADGTVDAGFGGSATITLLGRIAAGGAIGGDNCPSTAADLTQALGNLAFVAGKRTQTGITIANFYRDVRVRFVCDATNCPPSGVTVCSSDNFAVRADDLALAVTIGSPLRAGDATNGDTFSLSAAAKANAVDATTYNGTPQINPASVTAAASGPDNAGILDGSFGAAVGGTAGGSFGYSEVGYFTVAAGGIFDTVTATDTSGVDCSDDFNNTYVAANPASQVGCKFGNLAATGNIGRFTPAGFVSLVDGVPTPPIPSVTPFCGSGATGFTYAGQSALRLKLSLEARNTAGVRTQNYDATYANGDGLVELLAENADDDVNLGGALGHTGGPWTLGRYVINALGAFARNAAPNGPFDSLEIGARVTNGGGTDGDADGIKIGPEDMTVAGRNGIKLPGTTRVRFGRLRLLGAYGSELLPLRIPLRAEYYDGGSWKTNTADTCTTVPTTAVAIGNRNPAGLGSGASSVALRSAGTWDLILGVPALAGSADVGLDLGSGIAAATACLSSWSNGPSPVPVAASLSHLLGKWCGANYDKAPLARIKFGSPRAPFIYLRERY